ncbi:MAG: hypothetical protein ACOYNO_00590 [Saprospiraceae bacterium]
MDFQHPAEDNTAPLTHETAQEHKTVHPVPATLSIDLKALAHQMVQDKVNYRHALDLTLNEGALNGEKVYHFTGRDGYGKEVAWVLLSAEGKEVASFIHVTTPVAAMETPVVVVAPVSVQVDESVPQATVETPAAPVVVAVPTLTDETLPPTDSAEAVHEEVETTPAPVDITVHVNVVQAEGATELPAVEVTVETPQATVDVELENQEVEVEVETPHAAVEVEIENQQVEAEVETPQAAVEVELEMPQAVDMEMDLTDPILESDLFIYDDELINDYEPQLGAITEDARPEPAVSTQPVVVTLDAVGMEDIRLELNMETEYLYETMHSKLLRCRLYIFNPFHHIVFQQITLQNTEIRNLQNECAENAQLKLLVDKSRTVFDLQPKKAAVLDFVAVLPPNTTENYLFYVRFTVNVLMPVNTEGSASFPIEY